MSARNPLRVLSCLALAFILVTLAATSSRAGDGARRADGPIHSAGYVGRDIVISARDSAEYSPAIAYNSRHDEYMVVWENVAAGGHHDIYAQRVSGEGRLLSWFAVGSSPNSQMAPAVAYDPIKDRYLVVWLYDIWGDGSDWDVRGRFIPWDGPVPILTDFTICDWNSNQGHPGVAYARAMEEFLIVWTNFPAGQPSYISGRRFFANGNGSPNNNGFLISSGAEGRDFPDVTYNLTRNEYLVVWDVVKAGTAVDIWGVRLTGAGAPLAGGEFAIAGWPSIEEKPAVAACRQADQYLVAWQSDQDTGGSDFAIYARYLNGDAVPGNVYLIDDTTAKELNVDVSCDEAGQRYLLVWQTLYATNQYGVWGRRALSNETLYDQFGIVQPGPTQNREYPAVAGGSANSLVAWEHERDGNSNRDIHGRLLRWPAYLPLLVRHRP